MQIGFMQDGSRLAPSRSRDCDSAIKSIVNRKAGVDLSVYMGDGCYSALLVQLEPGQTSCNYLFGGRVAHFETVGQ